MSTAALIVAAGRGSRLGTALPKQYLSLGDGTVLRRTVSVFLSHPGIDRVQLVIGEGDADLCSIALAGLELPPPVVGGTNRQGSVLNGLEALTAARPQRVLIHDGARPFVDHALIDRVLAALDKGPGALPALAVTDSLKRGTGGRVDGAVDRDGLYRAQTPQGFHFLPILEAHRAAAGGELTDDVAVAEAAGITVTLVEGDEANFKITTAEDLARAQALAADADLGGGAVDLRVGNGFDVHRYAAGRPMILCGVTIEHPQGLAGHSDADVGLHAITDAILGAIAEGDIGDHFPPTEPKWRGTPSDVFLRHAAGLVSERGGRITAIDVTLICEAPKIKPHRAAMRAAIARILELPVERISVKATTTEKLGFTGRGEGIAAQATATVQLRAGATA